MKKTNYQPGARGINLANGTTFWVEPGQEIEIGPKDKDGKQHIDVDGNSVEIKGELPDFGRKADAQADAAAGDRIEALEAENATLKDQVADITKKLADATKK